MGDSNIRDDLNILEKLVFRDSINKSLNMGVRNIKGISKLCVPSCHNVTYNSFPKSGPVRQQLQLGGWQLAILAHRTAPVEVS